MKYFFRTVILTVFFIALFLSEFSYSADVGTPSEEIQELQTILAEGIDLYNQEDYIKAKLKFERVLSLDPANSEAKIYLAETKEKIEQEINGKETTLKSKDLYLQGLEYYKKKDFAEAKAKFEEALIVYGNTEALEYLDKIDSEVGEEKIKEEEIVRIDEEMLKEKERILRSKSMYIEGLYYSHKRDYVKAKAKFKKALEIYSDNGKAKEYLAKVEDAIKKGEEETKKINKAKNLYKEGMHFYRKKEYDKAKKRFEEALEVYPADEKAGAYLEKVYADIKEEESKTRKTLKARDSYVEGMYYFYEEKDYIKAKAKFEEALELDPKNKDARTYLKRANAEIDEREKRVEKLEERELVKKEVPVSEKKKEKIMEKLKEEEAERARKFEKMQNILKKGKQLYRRKNYSAAKAKFEEALGVDSENEDAKTYLRKTDTAIKEEEERKVRLKEEEEERASKIKEARAIAKEGISYYKKEDYAKAKAKFEEALDTNPKNKTAKKYLEKASIEIKKEEERIRRLKEEKDEITRRTQKAKDIVKVGISYYEEKDYVKAKAKFEEALDIDSENKDARTYLEDTNIEIEKAEEESRKVIKSLDIYMEGIDYYYLGNYTKAKKKFEEALKVNSNNDEAREYLEKVKIEEEGEKEVEITIRVEKDKDQRMKKAGSILKEGISYFEKMNYVKAKTKFEKALDIDPENMEAREFLSKVKVEIEKTEEESQNIVRSLDVYMEGIDYYYKEDYANAKERFEEALKINPDNEEARAYLDRVSREAEEVGIVEKIVTEKKEISEVEKKAKRAVAREEKVRKEKEKKAKREIARKTDQEKKLRKKKDKKLKKDAERKKRREERIKKAERKRKKREKERIRKEKSKRKSKLEKKAWGRFKPEEEGVKAILDDTGAEDLPPHKLTIDECIDIAARSSLQLEIADKQLNLAEMRVWEAGRKLGPTIKGKWEETAGKVNDRYYGGRKMLTEFSQPVFHGGELVFTLGQAKVNMEIVRNDYDRIKNELVLQVEKGYYSLDKAIKSLTIQDDLHEKASELNNIILRGYELGAINKIEYLNVFAKYSQINFQFISAQEDVLLAKLILQQAMSTEDQLDIVAVENPEIKNIDLDDCYTLGFANRPEMKINFLMVEYYLYEKKIMGARKWPKVDFMGAWGFAIEDYVWRDNVEGHRSNKFLPEWYWGFKASLPAFGNTVNYSFTKEKWQPVVSTTHGTESSTHTTSVSLLDSLNIYSDFVEADIGLNRAQQEYNKTKQEISLEIKEIFFKYKKAILQIEVAKHKLEYQKRQVDFIEAKSQMKEAPISNLLEEMIKLGEEEFSFLQAIADYYIAVKSLNKAVGIPGYF